MYSWPGDSNTITTKVILSGSTTPDMYTYMVLLLLKAIVPQQRHMSIYVTGPHLVGVAQVH